VVIEAESSKVGDCRLPPGLWKAMRAAPRLTIAATVTARAQYLARAYSDMTSDVARLCAVIDKLMPLHSKETLVQWKTMAEAGEFTALAEDLMLQHYDPRYEKHQDRTEASVTAISTDSLDDAALASLADRLVLALAAL
jgi:tRNA 2-selenouridine synthase